MEITETKNQHYIPRFLLRNWSGDDKRLNLVKFNNDKIVKIICGASIQSSFKDKWLYGKSPKYEKTLFANSVEPAFQKAIDEIRIKRGYVRDKRIQDYVLYQMCRTKFIVEMCSKNEEALIDLCFDENKAKEAGVSKDGMRTLLIKDEQGHSLGYEDALERLILPAMEPFISTLRKQKLIYSDFDLFIGENPVLVICPLVGQPGSHDSIQDPCSMILFPISPKEVIVLYRPEDCEVKNGYRLSKDEAHVFNSFQIQQTDDIIAFKSGFNEKEYAGYFDYGHGHRIITFPNGLQFMHTWQDLHSSGCDRCFRNIFDQKQKTIDYLTCASNLKK